MTNHETSGAQVWTPVRERLLLLTLACIQFTTVLDFIIIMPLGPQYMRVFNITPGQFSWIVSAYGVAAGITGLTAGFFLDRFDRKYALLWLYSGFTVGTLLCAFSPTYHLLVAARFLAGAFGGVVGAVILAIVGDVIPMERRGRAMGMVMSAFSIASIVGIPMGLWLAEGNLNFYSLSGWHLPFFALGLLSAAIVVAVIFVMPPLRGHMEHAQDEHPVARTWAVMTHPDHQKAFIFMAVLTSASFCVFPQIPDYMVSNVGLKDSQIFWIYLCGGICTLFSMNWVGRWADRSGKLRVFTITTLTTVLPILLVTNLPRVPLWAAIAAATLLMVCMSNRMVPAMAMMTGAVEARYRGGFMSINSSVQQLSVGVASVATGQILGLNQKGEITGFWINGLISVVCVLSCIYLAKFLKAPAQSRGVEEPMAVEAL